MKLPVLAVAALCLSGCATPYQDMGFLGGVRASQITSDTIQVTARGNAYTDPDTIQRYALRKAAETTLAGGFEYFSISGDADRTLTGRQTYAYGQSSWGSTWGSALSMPIVKPGQTLIVKMLHGPAPSPLPAGVYDAREVVRFLSMGGYTPPPPK